jgi:hypothetical protein
VQQSGGRFGAAGKVRKEQVENKCLRRVQVVEVPVSLTGIQSKKGAGCRLCLFKQVSGTLCERKNVISGEVASSVSEYSWFSDVETRPFIFGKMSFEIVLIAHSLYLLAAILNR